MICCCSRKAVRSTGQRRCTTSCGAWCPWKRLHVVATQEKRIRHPNGRHDVPAVTDRACVAAVLVRFLAQADVFLMFCGVFLVGGIGQADQHRFLASADVGLPVGFCEVCPMGMGTPTDQRYGNGFQFILISRIYTTCEGFMASKLQTDSGVSW